MLKTGINMTPAEYLHKRNKLHELYFPECKPLEGVLELLTNLKQNNIPMAVATSSHKNAFLIKSKNNSDIFDLFDGNIICGDDHRVLKGKPDPDIFIEAAKMLGCRDYSKCLVFEDAPMGVLAGINAGMNVVWVADPQMPIDPDLKSKCVVVLNSLLDFKPSEYGIPLKK
jgi:HAD superfamily hydrolase (TIGR01509 family)